MAYQNLSITNTYAGNPSHLTHQGLADVKATMGQGMQFSLYLTQLNNTNTLADTRKWPLCNSKRSPFLRKL